MLYSTCPLYWGWKGKNKCLEVSDDTNMEYLARVKAFNRFQLKMDIDFEMEAQNSEGELEMSASGKISTQKDVFVSIGSYDCKYQLFLTNTPYGGAEEKEYRIPLGYYRGAQKAAYQRWV